MSVSARKWRAEASIHASRVYHKVDSLSLSLHRVDRARSNTTQACTFATAINLPRVEGRTFIPLPCAHRCIPSRSPGVRFRGFPQWCAPLTDRRKYASSSRSERAYPLDRSIEENNGRGSMQMSPMRRWTWWCKNRDSTRGSDSTSVIVNVDGYSVHIWRGGGSVAFVEIVFFFF